MPKISFASLFRSANPDALDLLDRMLAFDPSQRIGVEQALEHRYLSIWHDASDEPNCPTAFDFAFEVVEDVQDMRVMILDEVRRFRHAVRNPHQQQQPPPQIDVQHAQHQQYHGQQQAMMGQNGVPIPQHYDASAYEEPRPEQLSGGGMNLEQELQGGLDALR